MNTTAVISSSALCVDYSNHYGRAVLPGEMFDKKNGEPQRNADDDEKDPD